MPISPGILCRQHGTCDQGDPEAMHCAYRSLRRRIASDFLNVAPLTACQRRVSPARQTASFANGDRRGMTSSASPPPTVVSFLTDVEGDGIYFDRFVRQSKVLEFRAIAPRFGRYPVRGPATGPSGTAWNLGEWDEDYFPYDKEVVFVNGAYGGDSMLVFGVSGCGASQRRLFVPSRCV